MSGFNKPFRPWSDHVPCQTCDGRYVRQKDGKLISCRSSCEVWKKFTEYRAAYKAEKEKERRMTGINADRRRRLEKSGKRGKRNGFEEAR